MFPAPLTSTFYQASTPSLLADVLRPHLAERDPATDEDAGFESAVLDRLHEPDLGAGTQVEVEDPPTFFERPLQDARRVLRCATVVVQTIAGEARAEAEAKAGGSAVDEMHHARYATNGPTAGARSTGQLEANQLVVGEVPREAGTDVQAEAHRAVTARQRFGDEAVCAEDQRRVESRLFHDDLNALDGVGHDHRQRFRDGLDDLDADVVDDRAVAEDLGVDGTPLSGR